MHRKGVTIGGKHTYRDLGMVLIDGSEVIGYPEVQTYSVEVPGRAKGPLDLTEALTGDVVFNNRTCSWKFADVREYGKRTDALVKFANMLHGRTLPFVLDDRPEYTGTGRFTVEVEENYRGFTLVNVTAVCEPFFSKGLQTYRYNAAGGITVRMMGGRMPVCPVFEFANETIVAMGDVHVKMNAGSYKIPDIWFTEGVNEIYLNSMPGSGNVPISTYASTEIHTHASDPVSDLMWDGVKGAALTIDEWAKDSVSSHRDSTTANTLYAVSTDTEKYAVYVQYEYADL